MGVFVDIIGNFLSTKTVLSHIFTGRYVNMSDRLG